VAAATEDTTVAEGEDFRRSEECGEDSGGTCHVARYDNHGLGPLRDHVETWKQRGAPWLRGAVTETRVIPYLHEVTARVRQEQGECRVRSQ
jgi:hypothetical protein